MSVKRVVLGDELPAPEWQGLRGMQVRGKWPGDREAGRIPLTDALSGPAWFGVREAQVRGVDLAGRAAPMQAVVAQREPTGPQGPLKGRPGVAAIVAGAPNTIASGPNTSAPLKAAPFDGGVSRGAGRDIRAAGKVGGALPVGVEGVLDRPTGRAEISASGLRGKGVSVPSRVRIYTTPTGELDIELPGPVGVGPLRLGKGTYYIGTPDPLKKK